PQYADVEAEIGGKRQKLADFVAAIETLPAARTGGVKNFMNSWPGMGGISDGLGIMGDSRVVLVPRWTYPQPEGGSEDSASESPGRIALTNLSVVSSSRGRQQQTTEELLGGQVVRKTRGGGMAYAQVLPATVWPVVAEETVIFRTIDSVMALDLLTGKVVGSTGSLLPMERTKQASGSRSRYYGGYQVPTGDDGRYALTIGEGKVFALGGFRPLTIDSSGGWGATPDKPADPDTSTLAALSIRAGLKLLWTAGRDSDNPLLRAGKFVTAPTYHAGRVYAVLVHLEGYHLVCLDAASGSLLWKSAISQLPPMREGYYRAMMGILFERVSPPAVADGRVFVLTNAGVLAAFDADTGQAVWACQYDSDVNRGGGGYYGGFSPQQAIHSANPLFVADGKVLCLPADSNVLLTVSADDGRTLWTLPRDGQRDLSLVDEQRVLLSGEGLMIVSLADRTKKFERTWMPFPGEPQGIYGRPAVTPNAVLACGISGGVGRVYRLDLRTYELSEVQLNHADGLLGNLVSAGGKLIAANSAGICAYFDYATARGMMTARLEKAPPEQRPRLMLERSQVALRSGQYADALADALQCRQLNESARDESLAETLRHHLYRTYVSVANHAETPQRMLELFLQAQETAVTDLNRRTMAVRLVRCYEAVGDLKKAAALAHEISDVHSEEQYPDVRIGPDADDVRRLGQEACFYRGREMGQEILLRGMIERHGRGFYAEFDAEARRAFETARSAGDAEALIACADRWPNSACASEARFAAGERFYRRGEAHLQQERRAPAWEQFDAAMRQLDRVIAQADNKMLTVSAAVAVAAMYAKMGRPDAAAQQADRAREFADRSGGPAAVAFADLRGPLEDVLASLKISPSALARRSPSAFLNPPLRDVYSLEGKGLLILRDQDSRPLTVGQGLLVLNGSDAVLLDTAADSYENAIRWRALAQVDGEQFLGRWTGTPPAMSLLAATGADGQTFILATRETVRWFEMRGGKAIDEKTFAELGITSFASMAAGEGMLLVAGTDGTLACVNLAARKTLWRARLPGKNAAPNAVMSIRGGRVLVTNDQGKRMTCYSLTEGGRVVGEWQGTNLEGYLADDGLVVVATGDEVSVHETGHAAKVLWKRKYDPGSGVSLLAASARGIAVWTGREGKIEVLALLAVEEGGRVLNTLQLPDTINL
ncbi:MAG TPA: hypothetical protein DCX07_13385, partial [Phycisphaerales bacterium]|nr:hypothetical protein [Phycisphaerales bacterium]